MFRSLTLLLVIGLTTFSIFPILATYEEFNQTYDEPAHIAGGLEWISRGTYTIDPINPPLARIAVALGPYLNGAKFINQLEYSKDSEISFPCKLGTEILHSGDSYYRNLTLARKGVLPFYIIATLLVWLYGRVLFGETVALLSTGLFVTLPPVIAHSGLATTDMPFTAMFLLAVFVFSIWIKNPTTIRAIIAVIALAITVLTKFSALIFTPFCFVSLAFLHRKTLRTTFTHKGKLVIGAGLCLLLFSLVIWGGYKFSVGSITTKDARPHLLIDRFLGSKGFLHDIAYSVGEAHIFPAESLFRGCMLVFAQNRDGAAVYALGKRLNGKAVWFFFPLALFVKTPIPFLILMITGLFFLVRKNQHEDHLLHLEPVIVAGCILAVCMMSSTNLGLRHILPIYPFLALISGFGAISLYRLSRPKYLWRTVLALLFLWQFVAYAKTHPDYLAYFNEIANNQPERYLVDSDLDWGQDLKRLARLLKDYNIEEIQLAYFGTADVSRHRLPTIRPLSPYKRTNGWIAISIFCLKVQKGFSWLEEYDNFIMVGKSIRLYHITDE